jgi:hypothetical protein
MSKKISQLTSATDITASDLMQIVDVEDGVMAPSGTNKKVTAQLLANELADIVSNGSINPAKLSSGALPSGITATATGSTTARTLANRFADVVNVKDFGAVGNGVADDTAAIQAAIDANPGGNIYFPSGKYNISSQIRIKRSWTSLISDSLGAAELRFTTNTENSAILVRSDLNPTYPSIYGVNILNIRLVKNIQNTTNGIGVEFDRADAIRFVNSEVAGFSTALKVSGGRNNFFSNLRLAAYNAYGFDGIKTTSIVEITSSSFSGGYTGFTQMFDNCIIGADFTTIYTVSITGNDYCSFSNCYISGATVSILRINGGSSHVYDNWFDQCYFDGVKSYNDDPSPLGVWIQENSPSTNFNAIQNFTDCLFGQLDNAVYIDEEAVIQVGFSDCRFTNIYEAGISCSSNDVDLRITGCTFRRVCSELPNKQVISIADASNAVIASNVFQFESYTTPPVGTTIIQLGGSMTAASVSITGNAFTSSSSNVTDYVNGGATISTLTITGNASNNTTNTIVGNIIGNKENSNQLSLDWYEEGTFAPTVSFGGASTGVTYEARTASATRIGNRVFFTIYVKLSSKGSSTGDLEIGDLPYTVNTTYPSNYTVSCGSLNTGAGDSNIDAVPSTDVNKIFVRKQVSGSAITITDADVTNSTYFNITGSYQVA